MIYQYDLALPLPTKDLYDTLIMLMALATAKDMYDRGEKRIDDFYNKYEDFYSPFLKDMERYELIVNGVKDTIADLYSKGIDPIRSAEGRAVVQQTIRKINPSEIGAMKANAKLGYAYLDAMQKLRSLGKYSQAQEDFDLALTGTTPFDLFSTVGAGGNINMWNRPSPIEASTLMGLTHKSYEGRTPRTLTKEDFANDPRLRNMAFDPRYEYTGYVDSDLMKIAPGASASLAGDPRALYFRDLARLKVIANGQEPTEANVEAQFLRDIADANSWALVDPVRKADDFAKMDLSYRQNLALEGQKHEYAKELQKRAHEYQMEEDENKALFSGNGNQPSDPYSIVLSNATKAKLNALAASMNNNQIEEYNKAIIKGDTDTANKLRAKAMKKWLIEDVNGSSRFQRIMNAEYGNDGVIQLNELLASRAVNGNIGLDASQILKMAGFKESSDGWYELTKGSTKVMSPHKIMQNILKYESGNGFTITDVKGGKTTREDIIKQLSDIEAEDYLWTNASTKTRASRTKAVTPQTVSDTGGYILAPNDKGIPTLYMKVAIKQGAKGWDVGSWFPQELHDGFWVEVPIHQNPNGGISLESVPVAFGQDLQLRKDYGDGASTHASENLRY